MALVSWALFVTWCMDATITVWTRCGVERRHGHHVSKDSFLHEYRHRKPLILLNLTDEWRARRSWTPENFALEYGHLTVELEYQIQRGPTSSIGNAIKLKDFILGPPDENSIALSFENYMILQSIRKDITPTPKLLAEVMAEPLFTVGRKGVGADFHQHIENWVAQISGRKAWFFAPPDAQGIQQFKGRHPCSLSKIVKEKSKKDRALKLHACNLGPGEVLYLPDGWFHATCNRDDFTIGVGGRGHAAPNHVACSFCDTSALRASGAKGHTQADVHGRPPLHVCVAANCSEGVVHFISQGADVAAHTKSHNVDASGSTHELQPIHVAVQKGHTSMMRLLVHNRASVEGEDSQGWQALHIAAGAGYVDSVAALLELRANPLAAEPHGGQPVHAAATEGYADVLRLLVNARASASAVDMHGRQPIHMARAKGDAEVIQVIEELQGSASSRGEL